jgi:hypothetical protein
VNPREFVAKFGLPKGVKEEELSGDRKLTQQEIGSVLREKWNVQPPLNCQGCHR